MPKTKKPASTGRNEIDAAHEFLAQAARLRPQLTKRREELARELARLDEVLSRLDRLEGDGRTRGDTQPNRASDSPSPSMSVRTGPVSRATVTKLVLDALSRASGPLNASVLAAAVSADREVSKANLQNVLRQLRENGLVKATGHAKRFNYSLARSGAPKAAAAPTKVGKKAKPAATKPTPKRAKKRGAKRVEGGPTLSQLILGALQKGSLGRGDLLKAVLALRPAASPKAVAVSLDKLVKARAVKTSGKKGAYRYAASSATSSAANAG